MTDKKNPVERKALEEIYRTGDTKGGVYGAIRRDILSDKKAYDALRKQQKSQRATNLYNSLEKIGINKRKRKDAIIDMARIYIEDGTLSPTDIIAYLALISDVELTITKCD